ncbi:MAG: arylsulfatase, partial [Betaproteobacteria bacterium]|nr:arylsulfatase [Betaproteobacteria bacterium]
GTAGVPVWNAGMRGSKGTTWIGGTRASSFWRWPGTLTPADCGTIRVEQFGNGTITTFPGSRPLITSPLGTGTITPLPNSPK